MYTEKRLLCLDAHSWDIGFKCWRGLERPFPGVQHEKEKQTFSFTFWECFTGRIFSRHGFAEPRNQSRSSRKESDLHTPPFMVISERQDRLNADRQLKRQRTSRILASPFGDKVPTDLGACVRTLGLHSLP